MSDKIVQLNEEIINGQIKELVRGSVEETLNELLEKEANQLTQAGRYERSEARQGYRSGHYDRNLTTTSGDVTLHMPRLKGVAFRALDADPHQQRNRAAQSRDSPQDTRDGMLFRRKLGLNARMSHVHNEITFLLGSEQRIEVLSCLLTDPNV